MANNRERRNFVNLVTQKVLPFYAGIQGFIVGSADHNTERLCEIVETLDPSRNLAYPNNSIPLILGIGTLSVMASGINYAFNNDPERATKIGLSTLGLGALTYAATYSGLLSAILEKF
ncbi:MAG TPA: hypothetical protein VJI68_00950 [Candidatus Nanoarchaeia archaeon]|nr:hypothetical protein [Candidatus Nanoarchaeia archaeon]